MQLLQPKDFDTISVSQQSTKYGKQLKYNHQATCTQVNCQLCHELNIKAQVKETNRSRHRQHSVSRTGSQFRPSQDSNRVKFQSLAKNRGTFGKQENLEEVRNKRYLSSYKDSYPVSNKPTVAPPREMSQSYQPQVKVQTLGHQPEATSDKYDEIRKMKQAMESMQNKEDRNNRREVEKMNSSRYSNFSKKDKFELVSMQDSTIELEQRLVELFGAEFMSKIDYESLVEENIEYIAHILGECECYKLKKEGICAIKKDPN